MVTVTRNKSRKSKAGLPLRLSPSRINVFRQCRQQYKFLYIDKLGDQYFRAKPFFTMGNHVHATLKDFFNVPVGSRTVETITQLLQKNWRRYQVGFRSAEDEQRWLGKAQLQLSNFVQNTDVTIEPLSMEWTFETAIAPGVILNGRIDRIDRYPDGTLHIIDYKTGNIPQEMEWTQVHLNALAATRNLNLPVSKISYLYLSSCTFASLTISPEDIDRTNWELLQVIQAIKKEKNHFPSVGKWCSRCDFRSICSRSSEVAAVVPEIQLGLWEDIEA